jgi:hypothetical protein
MALSDNGTLKKEKSNKMRYCLSFFFLFCYFAVPAQRQEPLPMHSQFEQLAPIQPLASPPDQSPCLGQKERINELTGQRQRWTALHPFFFYTPLALQKTLGREDWLSAEVGIFQDGKQFQLWLRLHFFGEDPKGLLGEVPQGGKLRLLPLRPQLPIELKALQPAQAQQQSDGRYRYELRYALPPSALTALQQHSLDQIEIHWTKGSQTYELHRLDLLQELLHCFH